MGTGYHEDYNFECYANCIGKTMRRAEFEINDKALAEELFATCEHGTLCLVDEDEPYAVPLNFVWHDFNTPYKMHRHIKL